MSIELIAPGTPASVRFSFEVFPARTSAAALALGYAVQHLAAAGPEFISVTYGASGSTRDASLDLLKYLRQYTDVVPMAHLTTVGMTPDEVRAVVAETLEADIFDFLALRGDPPRGLREGDAEVAGSLSSVDLIRLITEVRAESTRAPAGGRIAVAVYPNGHPLSRSRSEDIDWLVAKQEAGAKLGITQLFFHADEYLSFAEEAREAGLHIPLLPGMMPVTTLGQLRKVAELAGRPAPRELERGLEAAGGTSPDLGVAHTVELARKLLAGGAPSIHLYTFNRHEQVTAVLRELGHVTPHPLAPPTAAPVDQSRPAKA
ncbi:methylenetetrahydrofolate reductase [Leucobacter sp. W1153]|uniref:methylenetetrahydrofolate reductase n=1 Tax=Leucobacter sp. W1153 TaxID=3439064 RepID=UPI003F3561E7